MSDLSQYLEECFSKFGKIKITKEFIDYRNEHSKKFKNNGRTAEEKLIDSDCLIIEYMMTHTGYALPALNIRHDFRVISFNALVDVKVVNKWFNIPSNKKDEWYVRNVNEHDLTHFAFYRWIQYPDRPLIEGDEVELEYISTETAKHVLSNLSISQGDGWYYKPFKKLNVF